MLNAQRAGAAAAIVVNNVAGGGTVTMFGGVVGAGVTIPAMMLSMEDGQALLAYMAAGNVRCLT